MKATAAGNADLFAKFLILDSNQVGDAVW